MNEISYANEGGFDVSATSKAPSEVQSEAEGAPAQSSQSQGPDAAQSNTTPACPVALPVIFENIPAHLRALNSWVLWSFEWSSERGKWTKPLLQPSGHYAKVNAPSTWNSFEAVRAAYETGNFDGVGIVLTEEDDVVGVDLDKQTGKFGSLSELAVEALEAFDTYSERSPSGNGIRLFCTGTMEAKGHNNRKGVEIYRDAHYLTVTGHRIEGTPKTVEPAQDAINAFVAHHFPNSATPPSSSQTQKGSAPDIEAPRLKLHPDEILPRARAAKNGHKFRTLYDFGDLSDYENDESAADMALCRLLAFWCGRRPEVIDQLFRGSALFKAPGRAAKWDGPCSGGLTYGQYTIKRVLESCTQFFGDQKPVSVSDADVPVTCGFKADDIGNSQRFAAQHQSRARYCPPWKCWLIYDRDEGRWVRDECFVVEALAKATARSIDREAGDIEDEAKRDAMRKFAKQSTDRSRRQKMLEDARSEDDMIIRPTQLDIDRYLFNVQNGTIDLRTGKIRPHAPEDRLSQLAPVVFDPKAKCPVFEKFIADILGGDEELIEFMAQVLGYTLSGETDQQIFFPVVGEGSNGKSSLIQTVRRLMGTYAREFDPRTFMVQNTERIATDIADLMGVRMAITSESTATQRLDEGKVKRMTGMEDLVGEHKFEHPFTFSPQFKLFLVTNHLPQIKGTDHGIWRRMAPVPFEQHFWKEGDEKKGPENRRADLQLMGKLREEFPGILNWLLRGCLRWQEKKQLILPAQVMARKAAHRTEMDELGGFIEDCCILDPRAETRSRDLYDAYETWCRDNGQAFMSEGEFGCHLSRRGFPSGKGKGSNRNLRTRIGLVLKDQVGRRPTDTVLVDLLLSPNGLSSSGLF